jgi:homogentisate 1,2-dioxygenase
VVHEPFQPLENSNPSLICNFANAHITPNQLRWDPFDLPKDGEEVDFVTGLRTVAGAGDASTRNGLAIHVYHANKNMDNKAFYNSDGDFLIGKYNTMIYMSFTRMVW